MSTYPIQLGQAFVQGDAQSPVVAVDGSPISTQVNVMSRWPDNSVKHAIFSFYLTGNLNDDKAITFVEGTPAAGAPVTVNFTAVIEIKGTQINLSDLPGVVFISGPIACTYVHVDHSGSHDMSTFSSGSKIRPGFIVTHWTAINNAHVQFWGENSQLNLVGEALCDLRLFVNGSVVYTNLANSFSTHVMAYGSRWTKRFWVSAVSEPQLIKHDIAYLASSGAIYNYAPTDVVPENTIVAMQGQYANSLRDMFQQGLWQKAMGTAGGSDYIGTMTTWDILWLYTGDKRIRDVVFGQGDLGCQWPMHFREVDGSIYSVENHPSAQFGQFSQHLPSHGMQGSGADIDAWGWVPDTGHQPNHYFLMWLLTGNFFALEEDLFWASFSTAFYNGDATGYSCGRGPTGTEGGLPGSNCVQIRGQAWAFRNRVQQAAYAPDNHPFKPVLNRWVIDAIEIFEGERGILGTQFSGNTNWTWGHTVNPQTHPLHEWEGGNGSFVQAEVNPERATAGISTWECNFIVIALQRGLDLGYPVDALLAWMFTNVKGQQDNLQYLIGSNRTASYDNPRGVAFDGYQPGQPSYFGAMPFTTWAAVINAMDDAYYASSGQGTHQETWESKIFDLNHGYPNIAWCAASMLGCLSQWMIDHLTTNWNANPKWHILTRTNLPPPPPPVSTARGHRFTGVKLGPGKVKIGGA